MRRPPTLLSFTIAAALIWTPLMVPGSAHAGLLGFVGPAKGASEDPALAEVRALYKQGEVKFQTAEYEEALGLWIQAFGMLPDGDETRGIRHALVYNIAGAHSRAYEVNRDPAHLRKAKILLENYRADHVALYGEEPEAITERSEVDDRIAELDTMIAASEAAGETSPNGVGGELDADPTATEPPAPKPLSAQKQWEAEVKADPQLGPMWEKSQKRIGGGAVLTGIGGVFALLAIGAFVIAPAGGEFAGPVWAAGGLSGVIGLGLLIPGSVLLATGVSQRRKVLDAKPKPIARVVPIMLPGLAGAGVGYMLRF